MYKESAFTSKPDIRAWNLVYVICFTGQYVFSWLHIYICFLQKFLVQYQMVGAMLMWVSLCAVPQLFSQVLLKSVGCRIWKEERMARSSISTAIVLICRVIISWHVRRPSNFWTFMTQWFVSADNHNFLFSFTLTICGAIGYCQVLHAWC